MGIVGLVALGVLGWSLWSKNKEKETDANVIQEPIVVVPMEKPGKISWQISTDQLPSEANIFVTKTENSEDNLERLLSNFDLSKSDVVSDDPQTKFFGNNTNKSAYIAKSNGKIGYNYDIYDKSDLPAGNLWGETETKDDLTALVKRIKGNEDLGIKIDSVKYRKMVFPRWVDAEKKEADSMEIKASWTIEGVEVKTFYDSPILAVYGRNGTILKFEYVPLPTVEEKTKAKLKSLEEIQKQTVEDFDIWKKEGGRSFGLSEDQEITGQITATSINLVYMQDDKSEKIWPYFMIEGNGVSKEIGPVKVFLISKATK